MKSSAAPPSRRAALARELLGAALETVEPRRCTAETLARLRAEGEALDGCVVVAFGKAARGMAEAAVDACSPRAGVVLAFEHGQVGPLPMRRAGHPVPADGALAQAREVLALADGLGPDDAPSVRSSMRVSSAVCGSRAELVLGALGELEDELVASIGTDGVDGSSDAAGALADPEVTRRARDLGLDPSDHLRRNDADPFFARAGGRIETGPTGTNVADVCLYLGPALLVR